MINFDDYTKEELQELQSQLQVHLATKEPTPPSLHFANSIKIENSTYICKHNLSPVLQFKIEVNKETLQDHMTLWKIYFTEENEFNNYSLPNPDAQLKNQIISGFLDKFERYLSSQLDKEFGL